MSTTDTKNVSFNAGNGLEIKTWNPWPTNYTPTTGWRSYNCSVDILLPNSGGLFNVFLRASSKCGDFTDWGNIGSTQTYGAWNPNNPGVQYNANGTWKTHKIKRHNGSSWVDVPGRRHNGSSWVEVRG